MLMTADYTYVMAHVAVGMLNIKRMGDDDFQRDTAGRTR